MRKAILHLKKSDPVLGRIIERVGPFRMGFGEPNFHGLARTILYQQLNGRAAVTIFNRFAARAGNPLTPEGILKLTPAEMRSLGLSKQKSSYLLDMAARASRGELDFSKLPAMADQEVIEHLTQVKGVGVWTAHMFLMFALRRPDVLPTGDFGIRMAIYRHYLDKSAARNGSRAKAAKPPASPAGPKREKAKIKIKIKLPAPGEMEKIARAWAPYRSIASWYLWRSLDTKTTG